MYPSSCSHFVASKKKAYPSLYVFPCLGLLTALSAICVREVTGIDAVWGPGKKETMDAFSPDFPLTDASQWAFIVALKSTSLPTPLTW